jgi:light-harvesting complex I chlorophyll a/b binding protein 2
MCVGSDLESLRWFTQAEMMHGWWAMLAAAGILIPDLLVRCGFINTGYLWFDAGSREYFVDPWTLFVLQMALVGWAESRRCADFLRRSCVDIEPCFANRKNPVLDIGYPGGVWFDWPNWGWHGVALSHPVFQRIPGANYMCAQDVHTTHIVTNMENIKNNALLHIET